MIMKKLYLVYDAQYSGYSGNGLLAVFDTKEEAERFKGNDWYTIKEIELNKIYINGI